MVNRARYSVLCASVAGISLMGATPAIAAQAGASDATRQKGPTPNPQSQTETAQPTAVQANAQQQSTSTPSGDIVITATRRNSLLSQTPLSVSVVGAEALNRNNITNIVDLNGRLPSVVVGQSFGGSRVAIRGIGFNPIRPGDEGRVAYYLDGVYIARPTAQVGTLFDVDHIEVLRGPQGTLYGRNATGGALLVVTRDPTQVPSGYVNVTLGDYNSRVFNGALSTGLGLGLSARIAFETVNRTGYWKNIDTGRRDGDANTQSFRATILWEPSSVFRLRLTGDSHHEADHNYVLHAIRPGIVTDVYNSLYGSRDVAQPYDPDNHVKSYGFGARADYDITPSIKLSAIGGYRRLKSDLFLVGTATRLFSAASDFKDNSKQYTGELQLAGSGKPFEWIVGTSYFNEDQTPQLRSAILGRAFFGAAPNAPVQGTNSVANLKTDAWAVFAEGTYHVNDALSITAGMRYSWETKKSLNEYASLALFAPWNGPNLPDHGFTLQPPRAGFPRNSQVKFHSWTPRVAINYQFTPAISGYLTYVEGFKSGGFNYGTIQNPYRPETIKNYEGGLRARVGPLTVRSAVFFYDYSALQQTVQLPNIVGTFVLNTGNAKLSGVEAEFVLKPTSEFQIDGNGALLHSRFDTFRAVDQNRNVTVDIAGNKVPQAPRYTLNIGAQYAFLLPGGHLTLRGDYRRFGKTYFDIFNNQVMAQAPYGVGSASLTYETLDKHWRAGAFIENIGNTYAANSLAIQANALGGGVTGTLINPRTYGVKLGYSF